MTQAAAGGVALSQAVWSDACLAAALIAVDPSGLGGAVLRARAGPVRDAWLAILRGFDPAAPFRRIPLGITDDRLLGGLDLAATLRAGRPVAERGILAESDGGVVLLAMAERIPAGTAARMTAVLDTGAVRLERDGLASVTRTRFGVIALDEGIGEDEQVAPALCERLAFHLDLDCVSVRELPSAVSLASAASHLDLPSPAEIASARALLSAIRPDGPALEALCTAAVALGIASCRAPLLALRTARAAAALEGRTAIEDDDILLAARLVLAPRATQLPPDQASAPEQQADPGQQDQSGQEKLPDQDMNLPGLIAQTKDTADAAGLVSPGQWVVAAVCPNPQPEPPAPPVYCRPTQSVIAQPVAGNAAVVTVDAVFPPIEPEPEEET